ncbi:MAG TPA: hypothetical protein GX525_08220 [Bacilli bacterium]|nr:hypothetical protein [Bacilli bacterium]
MKKTIYSFLAMLFLASVLVTSVSADDDKGKPSCHCHMKKYGVHIDHYYELLAEKYAPDLVDEWKVISKDQQELMSKLKEDKDKKAEFKKNLKESSWYKRHKELEKQFTKAVKERDKNALKEIMPKVIEMQKELNDILSKTM